MALGHRQIQQGPCNYILYHYFDYVVVYPKKSFKKMTYGISRILMALQWLVQRNYMQIEWEIRHSYINLFV